MLNPVPGRTATELAKDAGEAVPDLAGELPQAANAFNDVTYGERPGTEPAYRMIADLDDHLRSRGAATTVTPAAPATRQLDGGAMTDIERPSRRRSSSVGAVPAGSSWRWWSSRSVAAVSTYLTAPRPGGRMDPASTSSEGAHALVALLRDHGVDVVVADDIAAVERAARPGHPGADGADDPPRRRGRAAAAGGRSRRQAGRRAGVAHQGDPRAGGSSRRGRAASAARRIAICGRPPGPGMCSSARATPSRRPATCP